MKYGQICHFFATIDCWFRVRPGYWQLRVYWSISDSGGSTSLQASDTWRSSGRWWADGNCSHADWGAASSWWGAYQMPVALFISSLTTVVIRAVAGWNHRIWLSYCLAVHLTATYTTCTTETVQQRCRCLLCQMLQCPPTTMLPSAPTIELSKDRHGSNVKLSQCSALSMCNRRLINVGSPMTTSPSQNSL